MNSRVVYGIIDRISGDVWSRNKWATPTSVPDLYQTRANAERQITKGKIATMLESAEWTKRHYPKSYRDYRPEVVEYTLTEIK